MSEVRGTTTSFSNFLKHCSNINIALNKHESHTPSLQEAQTELFLSNKEVVPSVLHFFEETYFPLPLVVTTPIVPNSS
jgi:hypothetical protein